MRRYKEKKMFSGKNICIALMALMVGVIAWPERRLLIRTNGEHQSAIPFATLTYNNDSNFANEDNSTIVTILTNRVSVTANESAQLSNHPQQVSKQDNVIYDNSIKRPTSTLLQHVNNKSRLAPIDPTQQWVSSAKLNSSSSTAQLLLFNLINDAPSEIVARGKTIDEREANGNNNDSISKRHKRDQRHYSDVHVNSHGHFNDSGYIWLHQSDNSMTAAIPSDSNANIKRAASNVITKRLAVSSTYNSSSDLDLSSISPHTKRTYIMSYKDHERSAVTPLEGDIVGGGSGNHNRDTKSENDFKGINIRYNPNTNNRILGHSRKPTHMTTHITDNRLDDGFHGTDKQMAPSLMMGSKPFVAHHHSYSLNHFDSTIQTNVSVNVGDTAYLTCKLRMIQDQLRVSWVRNLMILTSGDQRYTSDERFVPKHVEGTYDWILEIKNINIEDKGSYECQINSDPSPASAHFYLDVTAATIKILEEPIKYVPVDDDIKLTCIANFDGPTTRGGQNLQLAYNDDRAHGYYYSGGQVKTAQYIYWYRDNTSLNFNHPRSGIKVESRDNSTHMISDLTIRQAKNTDSGYYKCNLLPEIGSVGPAQINVIVGQMSSASSSSDAGYLYNNSRASNWRQQRTLCGTCVLALLLIIVSSTLLVSSK